MPFFQYNFTLLFVHKLMVVFHFQVLVHMKALQDRCVAEEGVISCLRKCNETPTNKHDQYKQALRTLNKDVKELNEKLKEETRQRVKEQKAKASLEKELTALLEQVEMARTDVVTKFKASQPLLTHVPSTMVTGLRTASSRLILSTHIWIYPRSLWTTPCWRRYLWGDRQLHPVGAGSKR